MIGLHSVDEKREFREEGGAGKWQGRGKNAREADSKSVSSSLCWPVRRDQHTPYPGMGKL